MKKIMFNDRYGLTAAVLNGSKKMTRRIIPLTDADSEYLDNAFDWDLRESVIIERYAQYKVGEIVAVAQAYRDLEKFNPDSYEDVMLSDGVICESSHPYSNLIRSGGWSNKMFVKADLMPHHIRINDIKVERLKEISDEDCIREGIDYTPLYGWYVKGIVGEFFTSPRDAFAALIDKVSGKGTWESNPWVFAYTFELVD